jgi:hypothetical protein
LRGVFYETAYLDYFNAGGRGLNLRGLVRWDTQKRRLAAELASPLRRNPAYHYRIASDFRNENWNLTPSFTASQSGLPETGFNTRKAAVHMGITSLVSGRWSWSADTELSHRSYRNIIGTPIGSDILAKGWQAKVAGQLKFDVLRRPEHRLYVTASIGPEIGRIWSHPAQLFEKLNGGLYIHWFPRRTGDDYATMAQIRTGKVFGKAPFDEWYALGTERDNDIWMRAHPDTHGGRKGGALRGRGYALASLELDKNVYASGWAVLKLGPFADTGKTTASLPQAATQQWLWDAGVQAKLRIFGFGFVIVYGRDLRSGGDSLYATARR